MGMFSEELAVLDRNTVKYMIDEMQNEIDEQKHTIDEQSQTIAKMQKEYHKSIANTIDILRSLNLSDAEIIARICDKYQMQESQVIPYL
jgi:predicted RNase H-like nuclease